MNSDIKIGNLKCFNCGTLNRFLLHSNIVRCESCNDELFKLSKTEGFIYVIYNPVIPDLYKVGFTTNLVEKRLNELNSPSSIPEGFVLVFGFDSENPQIDEQKIHAALRENRHSSKREFFSCSIYTIYKACKSIIGKHPIINELISNSDSIIKSYYPWGAARANYEMRNFICPKCNKTTKKKHHKMPLKAKYHCRFCDLFYSQHGLIIPNANNK